MAGEIPEENMRKTLDWADTLGSSIVLCDTVGKANPTLIDEKMRQLPMMQLMDLKNIFKISFSKLLSSNPKNKIETEKIFSRKIIILYVLELMRVKKWHTLP